MRPFALLLLVAGAAAADASLPPEGEHSPMWPEALDDLFLGVNARGEAALVTRVEYRLPTISGSVSLVRCRIYLFDAGGAPLFHAEEEPSLVLDGRVVEGGWRASAPAPFKLASGCAESIAAIMRAQKWTPVRASGPMRDDWVLRPDHEDDGLSNENLLRGENAEPASPGCRRLGPGIRVFSSPRSHALFLQNRSQHLIVAPTGWHLQIGGEC